MRRKTKIGKDDEIPVKTKGFIGFYLGNLCAHLSGFVTILILNAFTPLDFFKIQRTVLISEGGWKTFYLFYPIALGVVMLIQYRTQLPIANSFAQIKNENIISDELIDRGRQRLLNLPFYIAFVNLTTYFVTSALLAVTFSIFWQTPFNSCLFVVFRAVMIGLITAVLSFFIIEGYSRKIFIPLFFPKGRLTELKGTIKISIIRRIRMLNLAGTLNPMIILVVTFAFAMWEIENSTVSARDFGREIFLFTLILCSIFLAIVLVLNILVGNSLINPIRRMLGVIENVKGGDFTQRISVLSNDEIGVLGDAGNDMIRGLAERERIRDTFGKYVTPEIRDQILADQIPLDGERRRATLLFSDLRDFTTYVEANPPENVIRSMREYFTAMQQAIRLHQGLVLQYVGDEIEAVFGVPLRDEGHEDKAVKAALEMRKSLEKLNYNRSKQGRQAFRHGIGICTGTVLAGNTGSDDRLSYALIGDTVNLASRIQGLTKNFQWDILASEETVKGLKLKFNTKREPSQSIKGYSKPITVYQILE